MVFSPGFLDNTPDEAFEEMVAGMAQIIPAGTPEHTDLVRRIDVGADLPEVAVPTLVVVTTEDPLGAADTAERPGRGHPWCPAGGDPNWGLPFVEDPNEWAQIVTAFLGRVSHDKPSGRPAEAR
jgi:3-oxoadipate enol-lactonase